MTKQARPFWETKKLGDMTAAEWESLCDGCGKCCLNKIEFEDTGEIAFTNVACKLLDLHSCQCSDYKNRKKHVPDCVKLSPKNIEKIRWMPSTCAYRLLAEGKPLEPWHPLLSGDPETVHTSGISMRGRAISETRLSADMDELENYVLDGEP
jgi:uncharacterized protein